MDLLVVTGSAHASLGAAVARELRGATAGCLVERFPDGEQHVEVRDDVRGRAVFVVQPLAPPVGENAFELLLIADACHRSGAASVTAVLPYVGYARQDRVIEEGQPLAATVLANVLGAGRFAQFVAIDLHSAAIAAAVGAPLAHLTAVRTIAEALPPDAREEAVVVSPDLGAVKLAERYAQLLSLPLAIIHKVRLSGSEVAVRGVAGDVRGKRPIIVDDMISTGATVDAAVDALVAHGCRPELSVVATHGLFSASAHALLSRREIVHNVVTDSVPPPPRIPARLHVVPIAPLLADAIRRIATGGRLDGLLAVR